MSKTPRSLALAIVSIVVLGSTAGLMSAGIRVASRHKRVNELGDRLNAKRQTLQVLYDTRFRLITGWLDERSKNLASAGSLKPDISLVAPTFVGPLLPGPSAAMVKAELRALALVRAAIDESQRIGLAPQSSFDRFHRLQAAINSQTNKLLVKRLRALAASGQVKDLTVQLNEFDRVDREIAVTWRIYGEEALERNKLMARINDLPFGIASSPQLDPLLGQSSLAPGPLVPKTAASAGRL